LTLASKGGRCILSPFMIMFGEGKSGFGHVFAT
jgi:hypothetical protein